MFIEAIENPKQRSTDRELVIKPIEGKNTTATSGLVDNRLWKGGNRVRAVKDSTNNLWFVKYDAGAPPPVLQQKFTSFDRLMQTVKDYFNKRNIEIVDVKD